MELELYFASDAYCFPGAILARLHEADALVLKVFLLLCADRTLRGTKEQMITGLQNMLDADRAELEKALVFLTGAGVLQDASKRAKRIAVKKKKETATNETVSSLTGDTVPAAPAAAGQSAPKPSAKEQAVMPVSLPEYTSEQMAQLIDRTPSYKVIIDETQKICGRIFNPTEISRVLGLADYLKLDFEHILMLFAYCKKRGKTSVAYIVKTAYSLYNQGIDTRAAMEQYVKEAEAFDSFSGKIRSVFGIGERAFTAKEKEIIAGWIQNDISEELMRKAYEITVDNIGKTSFAYTNKVLLNWQQSGYKTLADVENAIQSYQSNKQEKASFETDEFFEAALRRGLEKLSEASAEG
ncbi:MAG: DnaD domain protein [Clostridiales bacterium]|nr:DnaD domain protein [Clostridiales bacterium]